MASYVKAAKKGVPFMTSKANRAGIGFRSVLTSGRLGNLGTTLPGGILLNYLFHLFLSGPDPDLLVGNFAGDFVKGRLNDGYPHAFLKGLRLHRHIDSFAQNHPCFIRSKERLSKSFGLYRGVLVDLYYDHFLSVHWSEFSSEPLDRYLHRVRRIIEGRQETLPPRLQGLIPLIFEDFIPSYQNVAGIDYALSRMGQRARQPNPLAGGGEELIHHYQGVREDFLAFLPEVQKEAQAFAETLKGIPRVDPDP